MIAQIGIQDLGFESALESGRVLWYRSETLHGKVFMLFYKRNKYNLVMIQNGKRIPTLSCPAIKDLMPEIEHINPEMSRWTISGETPVLEKHPEQVKVVWHYSYADLNNPAGQEIPETVVHCVQPVFPEPEKIRQAAPKIYFRQTPEEKRSEIVADLATGKVYRYAGGQIIFWENQIIWFFENEFKNISQTLGDIVSAVTVDKDYSYKQTIKKFTKLQKILLQEAASGQKIFA